ncbi:hypothetical protein EPO15_08090 [bacterium]|nr:MAG: hypothetical protein EPO15_08090 [bacterium]
MSPREARPPGSAALSWGGAAGLAASILVLASGAAWIKPYFYIPAWWSLLALLAGLNRRGATGEDLPDPGGFAGMALLSVPFWLAYELLNLRLLDWEYHGLPPFLPVRWAGYALAFATVLPAVTEVSAAVDARWPAGVPWARRPWLVSDGAAAASRALGALCLGLCILRPALFFPLAWAPAFLFCEHAVARERPRRSWLAGLAEGSPRRMLSLLVGGLLCGLLWESLNYWSGAKWRYTVPWPAGPKLFEMPWLGYLGFPPFALGCASAWEAHRLWWDDAPPVARAVWVFVLAGLSLLACAAIDARTAIL